MSLKIFRNAALFSVIFIAAASVFLAARQKPSPAVVSAARFLMGTVVSIETPAVPGMDISDGISGAFEEMARLEKIFSIHNSDSELSRLNRAASTGPVKVSDELFYVIKKAAEYSPKTAGAFDITVKPLRDLWTDSGEKGQPPDDKSIAEARSKTGIDSIDLDDKSGTVAFSGAGMAIDLGGIAKGYIVDRAIAVLKARGITSAIVNAGGDMYCMGSRPDGSKWKVGIQNPRDKKDVVYDIMVMDKGVDTSGDYERYFSVGDRRYSHIIDPRSGLAVGDGIVSATTVADDSMTADVFATALCVLGEDGLGIAESNGVDALIMIKSGAGLRTCMTKNFKDKYVVQGQNP